MMRRKITRLASIILAVSFLNSTPAMAATAPNTPTNVVVTSSSPANTPVESGTVSITWTASVADSTHDAPVYYIIKATAGSSTIQTTVARSGNLSEYSTTLSGLIGGTSYAVTVSAYRQEGTATSSAINLTAITSPESPGSLSTETAKQSIILTWAAPTNSGGSAVTSYTIRNNVSLETITVSDPSLTSKTILNLPAGSAAKFSIRANNSNGSSDWNAFKEEVIPALPSAPATPVISNGERSITASWVAVNSTSPVTSYKVYLRDMSKSSSETPTTTSLTSATFESLTAGASYTVRILATNIAGDGPLSDTSSVKTLPAATQLASNTPVFSPSTLPNLQRGASQVFSVTSPSGETITVTAVGTPSGACTYNANTRAVTAVQIGTCTVTATASSTTLYAIGIVNKVFTITKTLQTITFGQIANQPLPGPFVLTATASSGLAVTYTASDNCTITSGRVNFTGAGSCTVIAQQSGDDTYEVASPVTRTFTITPATNSNTSNNNNNSSGGGSSGGGFMGGGGGLPVITPVETSTPLAPLPPTPIPTPTPAPTPPPTPIPTPTVTATATPTPSASPSPSKAGITTKTSTFAVATTSKVIGPIKASTLSAATTSVSVKSTSNFQPTLPVVKKGEKVTMVIKDAKGKSYTVAALTVSKSGSLKLPAVKFTQKGSYTITIKIGTKTKVVKITSTK